MAKENRTRTLILVLVVAGCVRAVVSVSAATFSMSATPTPLSVGWENTNLQNSAIEFKSDGTGKQENGPHVASFTYLLKEAEVSLTPTRFQHGGKDVLLDKIVTIHYTCRREGDLLHMIRIDDPRREPTTFRRAK